MFTTVGWPLHAATFDVNTTQDAPASADAITQGVCDDGLGNCTLRAAIEVANVASDTSTVNVPPGIYTLTVAGTDETSTQSGGTFSVNHTPDASKGDLNITQSMNIVGAGSGQTFIGWAPDSQEDRVFHIEISPTATANISVSIQGVTVNNGYVPPPAILDDSVPTAVVEFMRSGGGIAIGGGAEIATVDPTATHGGGESGGGCGGGGGGCGSGGSGGHGGPGGNELGATVDMVTLSDVHVVNNQSGGDGGGIYNLAPLMLDHAVITGNTSGANGGGVYNDAAMTMTYTTLGAVAAPNSAENGGGLFETGFHTSVIDKSAIIGNTATGGGGIAGRRLALEIITRSTIAANSARDIGGGITTNGRVALTNVTVVGNTISTTTEGGGAGLNGFGPASGGSAGAIANASTYTLANTIIANNTIAGSAPVVANCGGTGEGDPTARFFSFGFNLEDADTCGLRGIGDQTGIDPMLQPLADNGGPTLTMALKEGSPAVDAGDNEVCTNNDQRGQLGRADGNLDGDFRCDIGAYELFIPSADLHMHNMSAPDTVYVGDSFDVTAQAHVDSSATSSSTGVQIATYPLPAGVTLSSATVTVPSGTQDCTQNAGIITCDVGTLAPGDIATVDMKVSAANPAPSLTITAAAIQSAPVDPNPANNTANIHVTVVGETDLGITSSGPAAPVGKGMNTDLHFSVTNSGPIDATSVRVGMMLPDNVTFSSVSLPGATCSYDDSVAPATVLCTIDRLLSGGTLSGTLTITGNTEGQGTTTFAVDAYQRDTNLSDNQSDTVLSVNEAPVDLSGHLFGCTLNPRGGFDPTLIVLIGAGLVGVFVSNRRQTRRH